MRNISKPILIYTPVVWLIILFFIPLGFIFVLSFSSKTGITTSTLSWTLENYTRVFDPIYLGIFIKSIWMSVLTTIICLVVGMYIAVAIAFASSPRIKVILLTLVILPFWTNLLVRTYSLIAIFRNKGIINGILEYCYDTITLLTQWLHIDISPIFGTRFLPLELLYNNTAVMFGLVYVHLPFTVLPLFAALDKLDRSHIEASIDLGASRGRTFFAVVIPQLHFGIFTAMLITFIPTLGAFVTADLLGGNDSLMIANVIERQFKSANDFPFGSALSLVLIYIMVAIMTLQYWLDSRTPK